MDDMIEAIRRFNRFYVSHIGAIDTHFLGEDISMAEARVLFEIARNAPVRAASLQEILQIDRGYLSRLITRLSRRALVARDATTQDRRTRPVSLTNSGARLVAQLDQRMRSAVEKALTVLDPMEQHDLVSSLSLAHRLLAPSAPATLTLRAPRSGEVSLIAARQSALYAESHGWGHMLECLIAETAAQFLREFVPDREACWIADLNGVMAGAVFLTDEAARGKPGTARLRLLHVEPFARRRGIGDALVQQCLNFAREKQYERVVLWTHTVLDTARRLYARNGFACVATAPHDLFGVPLQGEDWERHL
ncbi:bifunctional helix-turn-helix transcriptional regulator/GNAT family N-acetyltransferase [Asaia sp. VD9]|uniref:bifunctional helix-turn-helix transcriptional regulator/GNAT family N-acetyltransferase n=1 Tax=Asaia sp. VD9 TaxID=3081235 RepID=UPI003019F790